MQNKPIKTRLVKFKLPRYVTCPFCNKRQPFKKEKERYKLIKDINLDQPVLLKVRVVYAKCRNPGCNRQSFALPAPGIGRYQRSTLRLKDEAVTGVISDNSTYPRIARRLNRSFNTTGSKSAVDRWKHEAADTLDIKDIISRLNFSGILCIDEYKPKRDDSDRVVIGDAFIFNLRRVPRNKLKGHI